MLSIERSNENPHERLGERMSAVYIDKRDGKIGGDSYDKFAR